MRSCALCSLRVPVSEKNGHTEAITSVEFFTKDDLTDFLNNRKTKREGILQRFLVPKGLFWA